HGRAADRLAGSAGWIAGRGCEPRDQEAAMDGIVLHPVEASTIAPQVDLLFYALLAFSLGLGIFLTAMVVTYAVKYRRGSAADRSGEQSRNFWLEAGWISATTLVALGLFLWGA